MASAEGSPCGSQSGEQVIAFVDLWYDRLRDEPFLQSFLRAPETPPEIAAEGYHDLPVEERACLAAALVDRFEVLHGDAGLGVGPEGVDAVVYGLVFPARTGDAPPLEDQTPETAPEATALDAALAEQRSKPLDATTGARTTREASVEPAEELPPQAPSPITVADKASWPVLRNVLKTVPPVKGIGKPLGLYRDLIDGVTYQLCAEWGTGGISCSGAATYGQPVSLNADDADAGVDIVGVVTPIAGAGSGGLRFSVDKLPTEAQAPAAYVYAVFERPEAEKRLLVGFDGTGAGDRLADSSAVALTVDLLAAAQSIIKADLAVTHAGAGPSSTLVFGASTPGKKGAEIDPLRTAVRFQDPVPSSFTVNALFDLPAKSYSLTATAGSTPLVSAVGVVDTTAETSRNEFSTVIDRLPASTTVSVRELADGLDASYAATGPISKISFFDRATPKIAAPTTYDTLSAEIFGLPATMSLSYRTPLDLTYTASAPITKVSAQRQEFVEDVLQAAMSGAVHGIPARVHIVGELPSSAAPQTALSYESDTGITLVEAAFTGLVDLDGDPATPKQTAAASAAIESLPTAVDLVSDPAAQTVTWDADGPVGKVTAQVSAPYQGRDYELGATITTIPADWTLTAREDEYSFVAGTRDAPQGIGEVLVTATNHGEVDARALEPGNKALLRYDEATGDIDASLRISDIELVEYKPSTEVDPQDPDNPEKVKSGLLARVRAGGGEPFLVDADVRLVDDAAPSDPATQLAATVTLDPLPSDITVEKRPDGTIRYLGANTDLDADLVLGRLDAVDEARGEAGFGSVPARGASLRDGSVCNDDLIVKCATALVAHVAIDGTPSELVYTPEPMQLKINGFAPPAGSTLAASVQLDDLRKEDGSLGDVLRLDALLRGFASEGQDFTIGPIVSTTQGSYAALDVNFDGTAPLDPGENSGQNALVADMQAGSSLGHVEVSNIPRTIGLGAFFGESVMRVQNKQSHTLREVRALYSEVPATSFAAPPVVWQADASISKLASKTDLVVLPTGNVPVVTLNADEAGMTITAGLDLGLLKVPGLSGRFEATLQDLGSWVLTTVDATSGTTRIQSQPATGLIEARVPQLHLETSTVFSDPGANNGVYATLNGTLHVTVDAVRAILSMGGISDLTVKPGFATGLHGTFDRFHLGWGSVVLGLRPEKLTGEVVLKMFGGAITWTLASATVDLTRESIAKLPVVVDFHTYKHGQEPIFFQRNYLQTPPIASCDLSEEEGDYDREYFDLSQSPNRTSSSRNGVTVEPDPGGTSRYTVVADPYGVLPDPLLDLATVLFLGVYEKGFEVKLGCTDYYDPHEGPPNSIRII